MFKLYFGSQMLGLVLGLVALSGHFWLVHNSLTLTETQ